MPTLQQITENNVQDYMKLLSRTDELLKKFQLDKQSCPPEKQKELDERIDDVEVIRKQLITQVKEKGISREIIEKTGRLLSIF